MSLLVMVVAILFAINVSNHKKKPSLRASVTNHKSKPLQKNMEEKDTFACAINCMDGRVQDAVKNYMKKEYGVDWIDMITEPGPDKILAEHTDTPVIEDLKKRIDISVNKHGSKVVAIAGHFGCAGNPVDREKHESDLREAKKVVESFGFNIEVVLLWVDDGWQTAEVIH